MAHLKSEIVVLIDVSAFHHHQEGEEYNQSHLIDQVTEAVSFQISRGVITNRKLIKLGMEPNLARVKWTYNFFDSTCSVQQQQQTRIAQPMQSLTYKCWDLFEDSLDKAVKSYLPNNGGTGGTKEDGCSNRVKNIVNFLQQLILHDNNMTPRSNVVDDLSSKSSFSASPIKKFIFVFTWVPKTFTSLVHLATGISQCKYSIASSTQCALDDIRVCMVDVKYDSIKLQEWDTLPRFWDEFYDNEQHSSCSKVDTSLSLKITCVKKIMMIHKLLELRFPWMYGYSVGIPVGYGMGMKRLRQWERCPLPVSARESRCLPLRKCWSTEMY